MLVPVLFGPTWKPFTLVIAMIFVACQLGCVQRRFTVRTNPPGALVYIDDQEIGYTPVSTPFTYYGTRKIQLIKDGYETLTVKQTFNPPWYQIPPFDFVSDNFWPQEIRDERVVDFELIPQQVVPTEKLRERAENLRNSVRQGVVTPLLNPAPASPGPTAPFAPTGPFATPAPGPQP